MRGKPFEPGVSGNPNGRPPKIRSLTALLEKELEQQGEGGDKTRQEIMAAMTAKLISEGRAEFPDGREVEVNSREWIDLMKWVYAQIDGPPKNDDDLRKLTDDEIIALATGGNGGSNSSRAGAAKAKTGSG